MRAERGHPEAPPPLAHRALAAAPEVEGDGPGERDEQTRGGRHEGGERPGRDERAQQLAAQARPGRLGQAQDHGVGLAREVELGQQRAPEQPVDDGERVEEGEQAEHADGRAARGRPVGVRVEADEDVGQAHRPQEGGDEQRVDEHRRDRALVAHRPRPLLAALGIDPLADRDRRVGGQPHGAGRQLALLARAGAPGDAVDAVARRLGEGDQRGHVELDDEPARRRPRQLVAEQRGALGQPAQVEQQQARREGDRERLQPVLERLHVGDAAHAAGRDVARHDGADREHPDPVGRARHLARASAPRP